ncbi:MarR family transcriptional regulator with acetyltransferase activity [Marinomonas alcarazii]|uniref:MarR family transcriptional regulator with acetyltransferase activity n=1 Tax=Marinomonas alcarazii TaxID=491949 RepID=A0A318VEA1_9GAMM|nr:bifunctional helix-turn-helix transcriptional regulator/GNAT family N-acetyltransferase [Marinomonas alcarazii]PYF84725.1 MarR family transcriptional regulator with acetyltransferase activity [Marinomonas alcarazii]
MEQFGVLTLGSRLKRLSDHLFMQVQEIYSQCEIPISATFFPILRLLQKTGSLSVMEIADSLNLSHPAVSKQTTKMIKEGLLEKTVDEQDQRRSSLRLSNSGLSAMQRVEPVLQEMKIILERMLDFSSENFMEGLTCLESQILSGSSLADKVLDRLESIEIVPMESQHEQAFYDLNMAWLERYFPEQITEKDRVQLSNPQERIISEGGMVWVAIRKTKSVDSVVGTIAFAPTEGFGADNKRAEVFKLSVAEHAQGKGIAQRLLSAAIDFSAQQGFSVLSLETSSILKSARCLYDKNGFIEKAFPNPSLYERADVYMEKTLTLTKSRDMS